jgi:hypothetical protein
MIKREKIISLKEFKENRKLVAPDGTPYTGVYTDYYDWENDQKEREEYYKDGKENGLSTWWCENGQIECEGFFKDGTGVDDPRTELDENELSSPLSTTVEFIKDDCLDTLCPLLGVWFVIYIFDVWL